ncbi:MAG: CaiB/BaiF CoA transferase family protein, partial [Acidimicrobiales bacterium]
LEPPGGAESRAIGPWLDDEPGPDRSLAFWADNVGKRSVRLSREVGSVDGDEVLELCSAADVLVHTLRAREAEAAGLGYRALETRFPGLVVCSLTPFGLTGPWTDYEADDLVLMALGGSMAACGYAPSGPDGYDTPPLASHGEQAWRTASTYAAIGVLAALHWREQSGRGQLVEVSAHECSASMTEWHLMAYLCSGQVHRRGPHPTLRAADGRLVAALTPDFLGPHVFDRMLEMLESDGVAGPLSDPEFADPARRAANYGEVWRALKRLAGKHDAEELYRLGQSAGLPWGVIRAPEETLEDRHLRARGHFVALSHPEVGRTVDYPGAPFVANGSPWTMTRRPPLLGEHTQEVLSEWLGRR